MRAFKKGISFILLNAVIVLLMQFLLISPYQYEDEIEKFYEGDYDTVVIGSSYGRNLVLDRMPDGEHIYDLARPRVPIIDFAYIIRELDKHSDLKRVYYDISVQYWTGELGSVNRVNMMNILSGQEKAEYFLKVLTAERANDFFFRYDLNGDILRSIPENVRVKLQRMFHTEPPVQEALPPADPDAEPAPVEHGIMELNPLQFNPDQILPKALDAFDQLVTYCQDNDIELIVYINAFARERIQAENMGDIHDYFARLLEQYGLELYDLNYVKWELFPRDLMEYYDMDGHMLHPLAVRQTDIFSEILTSEDPSQYFETNYQDVLDGIKTYEEDAA